MNIHKYSIYTINILNILYILYIHQGFLEVHAWTSSSRSRWWKLSYFLCGSRNASMPANTLDFGLDILKSRNLLQKMTENDCRAEYWEFSSKIARAMPQCHRAPSTVGVSKYVCMYVCGWVGVCARAYVCACVCQCIPSILNEFSQKVDLLLNPPYKITIELAVENAYPKSACAMLVHSIQNFGKFPRPRLWQQRWSPPRKRKLKASSIVVLLSQLKKSWIWEKITVANFCILLWQMSFCGVNWIKPWLFEIFFRPQLWRQQRWCVVLPRAGTNSQKKRTDFPESRLAAECAMWH